MSSKVETSKSKRFEYQRFHLIKTGLKSPVFIFNNFPRSLEFRYK